MDHLQITLNGYNLIFLGFDNFADGIDVHGVLLLGQLVDQAPPTVSFVLLLDFSSQKLFSTILLFRPTCRNTLERSVIPDVLIMSP